MDTILPSKPSSYGELIKQSLNLYRLSFAKITLLTFLMSITVFFPPIVSYLTGRNFSFNVALISWNQLWIVLVNFISVGLFISILWHMHCELRKIDEPLTDDLRMGLKKVFSVFIGSLLAIFLMTVVSFIAFLIQITIFKNINIAFLTGNLFVEIFVILLFFLEVILLFYAASFFVFFIPILSTRKKGILDSFEHSVSLVWNHWWKMFSVQITPWMYYFALLAMLNFIGMNFQFFVLHKKTAFFSVIILQILIFAIFIPWVASLLLVQLHDLEVRKKLAKNE